METVRFANLVTSRPHILVVSSWQTVNIGDIGHTPGILSLLRRHVPEAVITLWPNHLDRRTREMLLAAFPELNVVEGTCDAGGSPTTPELQAAFEAADFLLHSSGPHLVGISQIESWRRYTGKPYGVYGVTIDPLAHVLDDPGRPVAGASLAEQSRQIAALSRDHIDRRHREILDGAAFVFCRDTLSLAYLRNQGIASPLLDFAPDAAFGIDIRDDARADAFLVAHGLTPGGFVCAIPRLRYTPYHLTHNRPATRHDLVRAEISDRHRESDMAKLREAIVQCVRSTDLKVLLCAEMTYQVELGKSGVYDRLPDDVKPRVVWRPTYWLPDEACSTYARSRLLLSMDNHSPIFALAFGKPTIFLRHPTDTIKGRMWQDLQLGDWFMETDAVDGAGIAAKVIAIDSDYSGAMARVSAIMARVNQLQADTMALLGEILGVRRGA